MKRKIVVNIILIMCLFSCEEFFVESDVPNTYVSNFELFWNDFDRNYPSFVIKKIDWDNIYQQSTQEIKLFNDDKEFFDFLSILS